MAAAHGGTPDGAVDSAIALDEGGLFLSGWLSGFATGGELRLEGRAGGGTLIDLDYRFRRLDVENAQPGSQGELHGFACLAEVSRGSVQTPGLRLEITGAGGATTALAIPSPVLDPVLGRRHIVDLLALGEPSDSFLGRQAYPAVERLHRKIQPTLGARSVLDRGRVPRRAEVSIIIPVYGNLDLLTPQIALLARDPEIHRAEIVIVLDSPEIEAELAALSYHLHQLYRLPMRVVTTNQNSGFANANNIGVEHASGKLLLLLNSDVFPDRVGWLNSLIAAFRADGGAAAVGPKLLYEDGSLQHAGLYFERDAVTGRWQNLHFHKGMPGSLRAANEPRRVPALTAACMLLARADFIGAGGFDPAYALGDYEDSDLCLRLQESGSECRYVPEATLYHLERQSFACGESGHVVYNRWLFTHHWDERIEELMEAFAVAPSGGPAELTVTP